jgi:hypothetical protein
MTDEQPLGSGNMVLYLVFSDNNGQSWSRPVLVANSVTSARGSISMKRDPVSGSIIFAWQDARNQENQQEVNTFLAIFTKEELDKLQK